MPAGRPSKYRDSMCQTVIECGKQGMGMAEIAAKLDVSRDTIHQWTNPEGDFYKPAFSDAINKAKLHSQAWWEKQGRKGLENRNFNYVGWFMNMKNRFGKDWMDRQQVELTGEIGLIGLPGINDDKV